MSKRPPPWFDYTKHPDYLDAIDKMAEQAEKNPPIWPHSAPEFGAPPPGVNFLSLGHGDCLDGLHEFEDDCVAAVITDPLYGISYEGKAWTPRSPASGCGAKSCACSGPAD